MAVKNTSRLPAGKTLTSNNPEKPLRLSQTPKNFSKNNYFLKETQDQINAYWNYMPNRVDIEQEMVFGLEDYKAYEVVAQSVKHDTGTLISDDWRRFVFRDIFYDCPIGTKFRVAPGYDLSLDDAKKYIFLVVNKENDITPTNAVVVRRCNGTLGSTYLDSRGNLCYHYEPVIQLGITNTDFHYNMMVNDPSAALTIIVQHNQYTRNYYINQRFVVGYDRTYRITNIDKFYSNNTYDPENVGLMTLYLAIDNIAEQDDFAKRIAYNQEQQINQVEEITSEDYYIKVIAPDAIYFEENAEFMTRGSTFPDVIPFQLAYGANEFEAYLYKSEIDQGVPIHMSYSIDGLDESEWDKYVRLDDVTDNTYTITKLKYCTHSLKLRFYLDEEESPTGSKLETALTVSLAGVI